MAESKKNGLLRGFGELFSDTEGSYQKAAKNRGLYSFDEVENDQSVLELDVQKVYPNPEQPRKYFDDGALSELAESIKKHGVIMPIVVNRSDDGRYMIIAGERRYRASILAGKTSVPAVIKDYDVQKVKEIALIENIQREDLNPIEAARAMQVLMHEYSLTQEDLAERLGKSRPAVTNALRLLTLDGAVIALIEQGKISAGHGRALVSLEKDMQLQLSQQAVREGWSVREIERRAKAVLNPESSKKRSKKKKRVIETADLKVFVDRMRNLFGTKVQLIGNTEKGRISIEYYSREDLERIYEVLESCEDN